VFDDLNRKLRMPTQSEALPGRSERMPVAQTHFVSGHRLAPPFPEGMEMAMFGLGCFWGAERQFWQQKGVYSTAVGYAAGITPNPTYQEVCSGLTGHNEVVRVLFDPAVISYADLLRVSGKRMIRPRVCGKVMTGARSIARVSMSIARSKRR